MNLNRFEEELKKLNIELTNEQYKNLEMYYEMLIEYNKVMNLTGITEKEEVYLKHFYDSLTIVKAIDLNKIETLCDIGTGAGFPGLVLKIVFPKIKITLIDSLNKRIKFLNDVIEKLKLTNIETIHHRIEEYGMINREMYDIVTARAVAPLNVLLEYAIPIVKVNGYFIPLKGNIDNEISYLNAMNKLDVVEEKYIKFLLPIEESKRTIIKFKKTNKTSKKFPRIYKEIKNKPL